MRLYSQTGVAARRFQKRHRNQLWQSDIKYGPYLPIGPNGMKKQVYLVAFIDDATRFVLHAAVYPTLDSRIIEDAFRQAIHKYGVPEAVYFDNGKQYRTKWMSRTCSKIGTRLTYTRPYAAESKGKIERFNRVIDSFISEAVIQKPNTLGSSE
ncbi:DDE-type integrase/transposase/recombinase [Cytobacillus firmus]|uniref:DDE-type integrase/transposase/recombinase n=1 Tax=Cytobacillus firmus TaxID=1399 RepID=UPI00369223C0